MGEALKAAQWVEKCVRELEQARVCFGHGTGDAHDEAAWLVLHVLGAPLDGSFRDWGREVDPVQAGRIADLLSRRISERRPLAYLLGEAWFCGLRFAVNESVLVPRSPFAELIEAGFAPWVIPGTLQRALDLCTGSGCIAIAMARWIPGLQVDAADISEEALAVAAANVAHHAVGDRVRIVHSDLFDALGGRRYDLIVSNPPYVSDVELAGLPPEYGWEPELGLRAAADGLECVLRIMRDAPAHLVEGGLLFCEVGEAADRLQERLPRVPLVWPDFEHGGGGIFTISREQLVQAAALLDAALAGR